MAPLEVWHKRGIRGGYSVAANIVAGIVAAFIDPDFMRQNAVVLGVLAALITLTVFFWDKIRSLKAENAALRASPLASLATDELDRHLSAARAEALQEVSKLMIREPPTLMQYEDGARETERLRELLQTIGHTSESLQLIRSFQNHYWDWRFANSVDPGNNVEATRWRHQSILFHNDAIQALGAGLQAWLRREEMAVAMDQVRLRLDAGKIHWPIPSIAFSAAPTAPGFKLTVQEGLPRLQPAATPPSSPPPAQRRRKKKDKPNQ